MKIKVAKYISDFLVKNGIKDCFMVTGGGAMHLDDAFGHQEGLNCVFNHHEQACAIAAEAYARINNQMALCCVTSGPGGTNAITGVVGAWLDSIPMLVISGQVRYDTTARSTGLPLRAMGDQEFDICKAVGCMTKYCEMVTDPLKIKYCLQKALYYANEGRKGPVWLDIPLDIQGAYIDTKDLYADFVPPQNEYEAKDEDVEKILEALKKAKKPIINAGSAIRYSGGYDVFRELIEKLNVPVVTGWNSIDLIEDEHPLYVGRTGIMGDRAGNFAIQNSDFILSLGSRLSIRQVGYNYQTWAKKAYVVDVDIDSAELQKPTLHIDLPICADVKSVMEKLVSNIKDEDKFNNQPWLDKCIEWKKQYPVVQQKHYDDNDLTNVYAFIKELSKALPNDYTTVVGNGSACVVGSHAYEIHKNSRFIINSAIASMGYDLPAAIGVSVALDKQEIVCISGDGSIQMNLQELQTIITNKLPIKIFIINNNGYHSIRQTQDKFFDKPYVGVGPMSNDLEFPDFSKLAYAYGYPYVKCESNSELKQAIDKVFSIDGPVMAEIFVGAKQVFEPKSSAKKLDDGTIVSPPLDDMAPFLDREEFEKTHFE